MAREWQDSGECGKGAALTELQYCVTVAVAMTERADQRICIQF